MKINNNSITLLSNIQTLEQSQLLNYLLINIYFWYQIPLLYSLYYNKAVFKIIIIYILILEKKDLQVLIFYTPLK